MLARFTSVVLSCLGLFCLAHAQVPMTGAGLGTPAPPASYTGQGDIVAATAWSGLRAYSSAKRGTKVANVCNPTDATGADCADWNSNATTGDLVATTINGADCTMVSCTVKVLYDQTGNTACSTGASVPCDFATIALAKANRPILVANCVTTRWCMDYGAGSKYLITTTPGGTNATYTASQVLTFSFVFFHTNAGRSDLNAACGVNFGSTANNVYCSFGTFTQLSLGAGWDGAWHTLHGVGNGASGDIHTDSTTRTNDLGAGGIATNFYCGRNANNFVGKAVECGTWGPGVGAISAANMNSMSSNAKTYWGY